MQHHATLYEVLEVSPFASAKIIKAAFRCLAQSTHPDKNPDVTASERFAHLNHAYSVLSDPGQRQRYDQTIALHSGRPDRRGSGISEHAASKPGHDPHPVTRAFVFRKLG